MHSAAAPVTNPNMHNFASSKPKPMEHYDVTIIGAGLAGLHCARLLGRRGLRVLLVDRKDSLETSIHTTGIFVRRTLEDFDIPEDCLGPAVRHVTLYSPSRRRWNWSVLMTNSASAEWAGSTHAISITVCAPESTWMPGTRYAEHSREKQFAGATRH